MRGKAGQSGAARRRGGITPAYAGKRALFFRPRQAGRDHPRVCGEKISQRKSKWLKLGSPPRMRGKVALLTPRRRQQGITPAYAGKRDESVDLNRKKRDHPRVCGEKLSHGRSDRCTPGSPPRMRGKVRCCLPRRHLLRITPAYAGKSGCILLLRTKPKDHPRVCGEKRMPTSAILKTSGSPPRMRGKD